MSELMTVPQALSVKLTVNVPGIDVEMEGFRIFGLENVIEVSAEDQTPPSKAVVP
jgi:hypothetical protein